MIHCGWSRLDLGEVSSLILFLNVLMDLTTPGASSLENRKGERERKRWHYTNIQKKICAQAYIERERILKKFSPRFTENERRIHTPPSRWSTKVQEIQWHKLHTHTHTHTHTHARTHTPRTKLKGLYSVCDSSVWNLLFVFSMECFPWRISCLRLVLACSS